MISDAPLDVPNADAPVLNFALKSDDTSEGATLAKEFTCDATPAASMVSPSLRWTHGPAGTKSYAVVFNDTSISFLHGAIYDVAGTKLTKGIERTYEPLDPSGAKQTKAYDGKFGYAGPCPTGEHIYEFVLYALDVANVPDVTKDSTTKTVETELKKHALARTKLTVKYAR